MEQGIYSTHFQNLHIHVLLNTVQVLYIDTTANMFNIKEYIYQSGIQISLQAFLQAE